MFKIMIILLFIYYLKTIFIYHPNTREASIGILDSLKETIIKKKSTKLSKDETMTPEVIYSAVLGLLMLVFNIVEFICIFFSVSVVPLTIVPIAYLVFWLALFIKSITSRESKFFKELNTYSVEEGLSIIEKFKLKYSKVTVWNRIKSIIDCSFFGYVLYILFFI